MKKNMNYLRKISKYGLWIKKIKLQITKLPKPEIKAREQNNTIIFY